MQLQIADVSRCARNYTQALGLKNLEPPDVAVCSKLRLETHSPGDKHRDLPIFSQFALSLEQTMLSEVKLVCILEAANELPKQRNRVHWVHPFNVEA